MFGKPFGLADAFLSLYRRVAARDYKPQTTNYKPKVATFGKPFGVRCIVCFLNLGRFVLSLCQ